MSAEKSNSVEQELMEESTIQKFSVEDLTGVKAQI